MKEVYELYEISAAIDFLASTQEDGLGWVLAGLSRQLSRRADAIEYEISRLFESPQSERQDQSRNN